MRSTFLFYAKYGGCHFNYEEEFEDTKGAIRICKSKKDRQHNGQKKKDKQSSTKHYTENSYYEHDSAINNQSDNQLNLYPIKNI